MSKKQKLIKDQNRKWLISYTLFHIVLFALFAALISPTFENISSFLSKLRSPVGLFPLLSFPISIILEGLIPSRHKDKLVFWRMNDPQPGCRAFTAIAPKDPRIPKDTLARLFPDGFIGDPHEQNAAWYGLYRQHKNKPIVFGAYRAFLLTRDLAALTVVLIPFYTVAHLCWNSPASSIGYHILTLVLIAAVICLSSKNYGKRLVENVIVEAIVGKEGLKKEVSNEN